MHSEDTPRPAGTEQFEGTPVAAGGACPDAGRVPPKPGVRQLTDATAHDREAGSLGTMPALERSEGPSSSQELDARPGPVAAGGACPDAGRVPPELGVETQLDATGNDGEEAAPRGRAQHKRPLAKLLYRASSIIKLDRQHPGLRDLVDERLRQRAPQAEVLREIENKFGARVSRSVLSRYWLRQAAPEELEGRRLNREISALREEFVQDAIRRPGGDAWKILNAIVGMYILEERQKLGEADVMDLLTEQRRREELEIKRGHLEVAIEKLENEKKELDSRLETDRARREQIRSAVQNAAAAAGEGKPFDPSEVYAKIAAIIGTGPVPSGTGAGEAGEERVESSGLSS